MNLRCDFTLEELLTELERPNSPLEGYRSAREWAAELGVFETRMMGLLRLAAHHGKLLTAKETRLSIDGARRYVPVYAFKVGE